MAVSKPTHKIISIDYRGPIIPKGNIQGPVDPYREETSHIPAFLGLGYKVYEHVEGQEKIRLDFTNYDKDHTGDAGKAAEEFPTPVQEVIVVDEKGPVTEAVDVTDEAGKVVETKQTPVVIQTPVVAGNKGSNKAATTPNTSPSASKADPVEVKI